MGADALGLVLAALVPAIAARRWGPTDFAEYAVTYRLLALLQPALLLGMGIALPRVLAQHAHQDGPATADRQSEAFLLAAAIPVAAAAFVVAAALVAAPSTWGPLVFGGAGHRGVLFALALMLFGSCSCALVTASLRGRFRMTAANRLLVWYVGVVPLATVIVFRGVADVLFATGALWLAGSMVAERPWLFQRADVAAARTRMGGLLRFGTRRIPGELCLFGLFAVPPIVAASQESLVRAGYLSVGMSLVTLVGSLFTPISVVLLPHLSGLIGQGRVAEARDHLRLLVPISVVLAVGSSAALALSAPTWVRLYLGSSFVDAVPTVRLMALAIAPYALFITLRSVLDAAHERPVSVRNAGAALGLFAVGVPVLHRVGAEQAVAIAFVLGIWLLAVLTIGSVRSTLVSWREV
ncbi:MAG: lipopolysaccharide biosynthesis protein [Microthrixaceae bacterium]